jgi:hypothetical protein
LTVIDIYNVRYSPSAFIAPPVHSLKELKNATRSSEMVGQTDRARKGQ